MHKLIRGAAPQCLTRYQYGRDNWHRVHSADKAEIWAKLTAMQGQRCAYCEAAITAGQRHIEHFEQRRSQPALTFVWSNLFGSCNNEHSCGKHKDNKAGIYDPADLLKPDIDNPDDYFIFVYDGTIQARENLNEIQQRRALETLRILNLDAEHGSLRQQRRRVLSGYLETAENLRALCEELSPDAWQQLLEEELVLIAELPFVTAIRHLLAPPY